MKRLITVLIACLSVSSLSAQKQKNLADSVLLPQAEEIGVGFEIMPVLRFVLASMSSNTAVSQTAANQNVIWAKHFITADRALRFQVRPAFANSTTTNLVIDDVAFSADPVNNGNKTVEDQRKIATSDLTLGIGMEWRRGKRRIQGIYGADLLLGRGGSSTTYRYGNPMLSGTASATFTEDFDEGTVRNGTFRTLQEETGTSMRVSVRGFLGAEYFVAPKFSIAAEFGWGLMVNRVGEATTILEVWQQGQSITSTTTSGTQREIGVDTDNTGPQIRAMFYF